jgi:NitT/TauT family transport system ATP-binding protein
MSRHLKLVKLPQACAPAEPILEIRQLGKVFAIEGIHLKVLERVDFSVGQGELICIIGRSGCGKSTLLNILAGFTPPSAGQVLLKGRPVTRPGPERCVVFQEDALFPWLTVAENVAFGLHGPRKKIRAEVERILEMVGLNEFARYLPREISGGMKQRVAVARVLVLQPAVLLMDEPFAALDAQTREEMQNLLLTLWKKLGHTVLFVTHDVQEAVKLADRILIMEKNPGRIREQIPVDLPRPREAHQRFMALCGELLARLRAQP